MAHVRAFHHTQRPRRDFSIADALYRPGPRSPRGATRIDRLSGIGDVPRRAGEPSSPQTPDSPTRFDPFDRTARTARRDRRNLDSRHRGQNESVPLNVTLSSSCSDARPTAQLPSGLRGSPPGGDRAGKGAAGRRGCGQSRHRTDGQRDCCAGQRSYHS